MLFHHFSVKSTSYCGEWIVIIRRIKHCNIPQQKVKATVL